jgi:hypothetical protein
MLTELGITSGRIAINGQADAGSVYAIFTTLQKAMPGLTLVGELGDSALLEAMATKDEGEVDRLRRDNR